MLYDEIASYSKKTTSFHMPGHKGGKIHLLKDMYQLDVTEVEGLDDLHHPTGIIKEANERIKGLYNSGFSTMLVNGSTGGILSAIAGSLAFGSTVLIARNCHKAVYNGVLLNHLDSHYVIPTYLEEYGFFGEVTPEAVLVAFDNLKKSSKTFKAVIITSPTYEGIVSDIHKISEIAHANGAILIVDEAHGAHFIFSSSLPKSAIHSGADIVIQSAHKTLPCLTQTAFLHVSQDAIDQQRVSTQHIQKQLAIFQTSSPSYLLMSSMDKGIEYMDRHRESFEGYIQDLLAYLRTFESSYGTWLFNSNSEDRHKESKESSNEATTSGKQLSVAKNIDPTRLTFVIKNNLTTGWELSHLLRTEDAIQVELSGHNHIVAISTIADDIKDIYRLGVAIERILCKKTIQSSLRSPIMTQIKTVFLNHREQVCSIYDGFNATTKKVGLKDAIAETSTDFIIPYPPGIPLLVPGERYTQEIIDYIEYLLENGMEVYGIIEGEVSISVHKTRASNFERLK